MNSKITYKRDGRLLSVNIESRLLPNPIAVKFVVIEHELTNREEFVAPADHPALDDLLADLGIEIIDVVPIKNSDIPKPYSHRS